MLGIGVSQQRSDLLDGHNGACEKALGDADSSVNKVLTGGGAELLFEHTDYMHFCDAELF